MLSWLPIMCYLIIKLHSQKRRVGVIPTIEEIHGDVLTTLANQYWAPHSKLPKKQFSEKIIERIYYKEIGHRYLFDYEKLICLWVDYIGTPNCSLIDKIDMHEL